MINFKRLEIWNISYELGKMIYFKTQNFPEKERYGLTSQIRRASISIASNIAEGCGRNSQKDFRNFLFNALGSLREVETQLMFSRDLGYLPESDFQKIHIKIDETGAKLSKFIKKISLNIEQKHQS